MADWGKVAYGLYRAATRFASPLIHAHIRYRILRGLDHPTRWRERLGHPSSPRPLGPLLWFHAVSLGEGLAAIPVIKHCINHKPHFNVLMTTTTTSAFEAIKDQLPSGVIYQFAPVDTPRAVENFLGYWNPTAIFLMESELWPNLIISASEKGIPVALLNARMSFKSFRHWSEPVALPLIALMLSKLSLIIPLSTTQAIRFQLLQAPPHIIHFAGDLKYAVGDFDFSEKEDCKIEDLKLQIVNRPIWMAASIHKGEEEVILWVHKQLMTKYPGLVTILVPRHPQYGQQIIQSLQRQGMNAAVRSRTDAVPPSTNVYVVDTLVHWSRDLNRAAHLVIRTGLHKSQRLIVYPNIPSEEPGELRMLYRITRIAVVGGSFLPKLAGHNISEAAAAGCAVLTGPHVGHFSHMIAEMKRINSLSVLQVAGKMELLEALHHLFCKANELETRQNAAKQAFLTLSNGVVQRVWNLIDIRVLSKQASF